MGKRRRSAGFDCMLLGRARLSVGEDCLTDLLNVLLLMGESYRNIERTSGSASLELNYPCARRARLICRERGIEAELELCGGVPFLLLRLKKRPALAVGMLIAFIMIAIGNRVLWDVRIRGGEGIPEAELLDELAAHGVYPGALLSGLDVGNIQTRIAAEREDVAWISVNLIGTVAYVEVIGEIVPPPEKLPEGDGTNLVAARDGVIVGYEVIAGEPVLSVGQPVLKGDLLVGGLLDSERFGYRAIEARGKVFALTEYVFEVEIPYEYTVRVPEKKEICEISVFFFGFRQKFFKKGGFLGSEYDKIYSDIYIYSKGGVKVPVGLAVTSCPIYTESTVLRTQKEAADLAYSEINRRILGELPNADIVAKSYDSSESDDGEAYRLVCRVECIDDIALPVPFYINE